VVAAEHEEVLGIFDLVCEEQADGLEGLLATVYVVAEEEVVGLWWETAILEQAQQIVVLAVDVTTDLVGPKSALSRCGKPPELADCILATDLDWCLELKQNGLRDEDLARLGAQIAYLGLEQLNLLARPAAPDFEKSVYDRVQIYLGFRHSCDWLLAGVSDRVQGRASRGGVREMRVALYMTSPGRSLAGVRRVRRASRQRRNAVLRATLRARVSRPRQRQGAASRRDNLERTSDLNEPG
jgi:hypothetical protein